MEIDAGTYVPIIRPSGTPRDRLLVLIEPDRGAAGRNQRSSRRAPLRPGPGRASRRRRAAAPAQASARHAGRRDHVRRRPPSRGHAGGARCARASGCACDVLRDRRAGAAAPGAHGGDRRPRPRDRVARPPAHAATAAQRRGRPRPTSPGAPPRSRTRPDSRPGFIGRRTASTAPPVSPRRDAPACSRCCGPAGAGTGANSRLRGGSLPAPPKIWAPAT